MTSFLSTGLNSPALLLGLKSPNLPHCQDEHPGWMASVPHSWINIKCVPFTIPSGPDYHNETTDQSAPPAQQENSDGRKEEATDLTPTALREAPSSVFFECATCLPGLRAVLSADRTATQGNEGKAQAQWPDVFQVTRPQRSACVATSNLPWKQQSYTSR